MTGKRVRAFGLLVTAVALTTTGAGPAGAAAVVPAYGAITIADDGTGFTVATTYDPVLWDCRTEVEGQFNAPTAVKVTCTPNDQEGQEFNCPLMVLTTTTGGLGARAGGRAACTGSLDTGIISGANTAQRTGNLGNAYRVLCRAYGPGGLEGILIPPYAVKCAEPGLPTL